MNTEKGKRMQKHGKRSEGPGTVGGKMRGIFRRLGWLILVAVLQVRGIQAAEIPEGTEEAALHALRQAVAHESEWVKVHAAEFLLALGYDTEAVCEIFEQEAAAHGDETPYRIGIWRVLATGEEDPRRRREWIDKIRHAFLDPNGPDRLHAVETLGKLDYRPTDEERLALRAYVDERPPSDAVYAQWVLAKDGTAADVERLVDYLDDEDAMVRLRAAAALKHGGPLSDADWQRLADRALREEKDSIARVHLLGAAWTTAPDDAGTEELRARLTRMLQEGSPAEQKYAADAFARRGDVRMLPLLLPLLDHTDADVGVFAAYAVLRILRRVPVVIAGLDWAVIALYFLGMLLIGWFFSRRTNTTDDYLLGGRNQRPWAVGLSLFATLLSTLTYMAYPGEIIRHGPMILAGLLSYPVIFVLVGFLFIPVVMRLHVTSAYELLEQRLGLGVRMLGSGIFILIRLAWMAAIIFVTTKAIILPVLGFDPKWAPLIGAIIGVITLVYTSMGGIRAVIWTDVVQTGILFLGALLSIILVTAHLGGWEWFPTRWDAQWDPPVLWFDAGARTTLAGAFMMMLGWFVCTAGSDQMAIQRYLSTRDARAARRMFGMSLTASLLVACLLMCMGFALLAYFKTNPQMLPDGRALRASADLLFPRYIVLGLPQGISGLVVAGLLAAAMSSLSSGVNSAATVIEVDFIERFARKKRTQKSSVRMAKWTSAAVGIVVVLLSLSIGHVKGNLLEVVNKVGNLLTAPLFLFFFMAIYVPWARSIATMLGVAAAIAVAVAIAYFEIFGLSFIWIIPCSLLVGATVGACFSLVPLGPTARERVHLRASGEG